MTTPNNKSRKRRENRATDPFGGPSSRGNRISLGFALAALAIFLLLQWTGGDLGALLNDPASLPNSAPTLQPSPPADAQGAAGDHAEGTPVAQATLPPTAAPATTVEAQARGVQTPRATVQPTPTANAPPLERASDLPTIAYADLPPEAHDTIALIEEGGPFPFSRDGITFQNRERLLPRHPEGYYREYTVITPGERTRGARRIVAGEGGEMYYTADHYASFREIVR